MINKEEKKEVDELVTKVCLQKLVDIIELNFSIADDSIQLTLDNVNEYYRIVISSAGNEDSYTKFTLKNNIILQCLSLVDIANNYEIQMSSAPLLSLVKILKNPVTEKDNVNTIIAYYFNLIWNELDEEGMLDE